MKRTRITDRIFFLEPEDMRLFKACAGVLVDGPRKLVIDANMGPETAAFLAAEKPDTAIVSHYHLDHGVWAAAARQHAEATVFIPAGEESYLTDIDFFIEHTAAPHGLAAEWKHFTLHDCGYRELRDFKTYDPGHGFSDHHMVIECLDTRGHSPAHRSFYFPDSKVLFTGDLGVDRFGPWCGWSECDLLSLVSSILTLRELPTDVLLTSHGGMLTTGIRDAWDLALRRLLQRETFIRKRLDRGLSPEAIVEKGIFFPQKTGVPEPMRSFLYMWDTVMFDHHRRLLDAGGFKVHFPELAALI